MLSPAERPAVLPNRRILIVDDNEAIHNDFRKILAGTSREISASRAALFDERSGQSASVCYDVDSAFQGEQGYQMAAEAREAGRPYALAFVDMRMPPGWDGLKTIQKLWQTDPDLQVVICSAYSDHSWSDIHARLGQSDKLLILKKPFETAEVCQIASAMTEKWNLSLQARRKADAREAHMRAVVETAAEGILIFDADGRIESINPAGAAIFRLPATQVEGGSIEPLFSSAEDDPPILPSLIHSGGATTDVQREMTAVRGDGTGFPIQLTVRDFEAEGRTMYACIFRDMTEQKKLQLALVQAQKLQSVGQLAAGVAHEFNNLLQTIKGYAGFALKGVLPAEQRYGDLQEVLKATERAAHLTQQMLGFGRKRAMLPVDFPPNDLIRDLLRMLRPLIGETIDVQTLLDDEVGTLHADPTLIQQVLMNLCLNARDAMPGGGQLTIRTRDVVLDDAQCAVHPHAKPGRFVQMSITDTGGGMPPEVQEHIFEPFFTTKEVGKGTGLGLSVAYGIVEQHGGFIYTYSETDRGTVFKVYLPVVERPADASADADVAPPGGGKTLLVAENDEAVRQVILRTLEAAGYRPLAAKDGAEAVELFERSSDDIALVLLDVVMPRLGGHDALRAIRRIRPDIPVVFCTGYDPETAAGRLDDEGARILEKPIYPDVLLRVVREALDEAALCLAS